MLNHGRTKEDVVVALHLNPDALDLQTVSSKNREHSPQFLS